MDVWKAVCTFVALLRKERKELPDDPEQKRTMRRWLPAAAR